MSLPNFVVALCAALLLCAVAYPEYTRAEMGWERIFELPCRQQYFSSALLSSDSDWVAGGFNVLVAGTDRTVDQRQLDGLAIMAFGVGPGDTMYAAGSHGTIWRQVSRSQWKQEHQGRPPGSKGKVRDEGLLVGIRSVSSDAGSVLIAFGPRSLVLSRNEDGNWSPPADRSAAERLVHLANFGPNVALPRGCLMLQWNWLGPRDGWVMCHNRHAFMLTEGRWQGMGTAPRGCKVLWSSAQRKDEIFTSCGDDGKLWRFAGDAWKTIATVRGVRSLSANDHCVLAASKYAIWRHCL